MAKKMEAAFNELIDLICNYQPAPARGVMSYDQNQPVNAFDANDVNEFLNQVIERLEGLMKEVDTLESELEAEKAKASAAEPTKAFKPVTPAPQEKPRQETVPDDRFKEILLMAQKVRDEAIAKAESDAKGIVASAQAEADAMLGNLEERKSQLESRIAELKNSAAETVSKIRSLLEAQQELLNKSDLT